MVSWWIARGNLSDPRSEVSRQLHPPLSCADAQIVVPWCDTMCDQTCSQRFCSKKGEEKHHYHRDNNHNKYFKQFPAGAASATFHDSSAKLIKMSNYRRLVCLSLSKEVWKSNFRQYAQMKSRDGKSQRREEKRREERRSKKRKSQKKEDPGARKGRKVVAKHCVLPVICGSGGSESRLAKAAGAEPCGQMRGEKLHAVVARSTFPRQNVQSTSCSDHFWKLRCQKCARCCGAKHLSKSKLHKTPQCRTTFGSWHVDKVHAVVARSTFRSQKFKKLTSSEHFWKLRCWKCTPLWREAHFEVKCVKNWRVGSTLWRSDVVLRGRREGFCTLPEVSKTWGFCSITLHYTPLSYSYNYHYTYTTFHYTTLHYTTLHSTTLHSITLHYITLHYRHYTTLHYTTLHTLH